MFKETIAFFLKSTFALMVTFFAVRQAVMGPVWVFALVVPLLALPSVLLNGLVLSLRRGHYLGILEEHGWMRSLFSGATIRVVTVSTVSMVLSIVALARLAEAAPIDWLAVLVGIVLFWPLFLWLRSRPGAQLSLPFRQVYPVQWARWIAVILMVVAAYLIAVIEPSEQAALNLSLPDAHSALMRELLGFTHLATQLQAYTLDRVAEYGGWLRTVAIALDVVGQLSVAWVMISVVAIFAVPTAEFRRVIAPASTAVEAPKLSATTIAWTSALTTFFLLFVWLPQVAAFDTQLSGRNEVDEGSEAAPQQGYAESAAEMTQRLVREVERIGGDNYRLGTIEKLDEVYREYDMVRYENREQLIAAINAGSDLMIQNVDPFLDGYYSLWGEYARMFAMLTGDLEEEIGGKLDEALNANSPFAKFYDTMDQGLSSEASRIEAWHTQIAEVLDTNRISTVELAGNEIHVVADRPDPLQAFAPTFGTLNERMQSRWQVSSGMAGMTGVVVAVVVKKVAAKGTLKLAAKAVTKVAASKVAGGGGGAAAGALAGAGIGSVVPGLGTAAGALVGGIAGAVVGGVAVDAILLKLEEELQREAFRDEIIRAINDQRAEMIAIVNGAT